MLQNINIEEIKQYNASLKEQREKAATLKAQIDYTTNELSKLCQELSAELGKEVTKDNIEQIYNEEVTKINSTLQSGKAVLAKIANEGQTNVAQPVPQTQMMAQPQMPQQPVAPQMQQNAAPVVNTVAQSAMPGAPVVGTVFGNGNVQGQTQGQTLPPLFNL